MLDNTKINKVDEELLKKVEEKAKENLKGIINEKQIGYNGYLIDEMKRIFSEKGIEWKPDDGSVSID